MSEVLASLKKIGGNGEQYTETSLWLNPNPNTGFAKTTVTLSDSISNYKYIKITTKPLTTDTDTSHITSYLMSVEDWRKAYSLNSWLCVMGGISSSTYTRRFRYVSDTSAMIYESIQLGGSNTSTNGAIPLEILGINELAHQTVVGNYDTCAWTQFNGGVTPSFTTKGRAKAIWFTYRVTTSSTDANTFTNVNPVTGEINNDGLYRYLFNGTYDLQSTRSFVVTDNSVSLNNPVSSSQTTKAILSYTYE